MPELNKNNFQEAIVKTIAFFDLFDYPLTAWEIWKYLPGIRIEYEEVLDILKSGDFGGRIENDNSFFILRGRKEIIAIKMRRYYYADRKFKRAVWISKIFKNIPGVEMIAIGNLIGAHNLRQSSDIDFFIITVPGKVWTARFFCALIAKLLRLRPQPDKQKDTICLSFFASSAAMKLDNLMLKDGDNNIEDPYFLHWLAGLVPIYDSGGVYKELIEANHYIYDFFPNWQPAGISQRRDAGVKDRRLNNFLTNIFSTSENWLKAWQLKKFPAEIKELMNKDTRVVINDDIIKMHVNDRREEYREKLKKPESKE